MTDDPDDYPGGWFGPSWGALVNENSRHLPTPTGQTCMYCGATIADGDQGLVIPHMDEVEMILRPTHIACFGREVGVDITKEGRR